MRVVLILVSCLALCVADASAKAPRKRHASGNAAYAQAVKESTARAIALFPDYDTAGTSLHRAIQEELEWQKKNNPTFARQPDWPERIARACAALMGIEPARPMHASK